MCIARLVAETIYGTPVTPAINELANYGTGYRPIQLMYDKLYRPHSITLYTSDVRISTITIATEIYVYVLPIM